MGELWTLVVLVSAPLTKNISQPHKYSTFGDLCLATAAVKPGQNAKHKQLAKSQEVA